MHSTVFEFLFLTPIYFAYNNCAKYCDSFFEFGLLEFEFGRNIFIWLLLLSIEGNHIAPVWIERVFIELSRNRLIRFISLLEVTNNFLQFPILILIRMSCFLKILYTAPVLLRSNSSATSLLVGFAL